MPCWGRSVTKLLLSRCHTAILESSDTGDCCRQLHGGFLVYLAVAPLWLSGISCSCHAVAMRLSCSCHAVVLHLPCSCHAVAMEMPWMDGQTYKYRLRYIDDIEMLMYIYIYIFIYHSPFIYFITICM